MSALAVNDVRHQACSSFYHLFIILTFALIPSTLNSQYSYGAFASASIAAVAEGTTTNTATVNERETVQNENELNLHAAAAASAAAHLSSSSSMVDSILAATSPSSFASSTTDSDEDLTQLVFEPNLLNFDALAIGGTSNRVITIYNRHANRSVYLGSISGNVADFYSSFFEENLVPPLGNTTFNVVFLPRRLGKVQSNLVIHTSFGVLNYLVSVDV